MPFIPSCRFTPLELELSREALETMCNVKEGLIGMRNDPLQFQQVAAASHHLRLPSCHLPLLQVHHPCSCYRHQVSQVIKSIMNKIAADSQHGWLLHSGQGEISPPRRAFGPLPVMRGGKKTILMKRLRLQHQR